MRHAPPSPCIDVCKYKLRGRCIGCGMTKMEKQVAERARTPEARLQILRETLRAQASLGRSFAGWTGAYRAKCRRQGVDCPLDEPVAEAGDDAADT